MAETLHVVGLRDLDRAFGLASKHLQADLRDTLEEAAAPVRSDAQTLAGTTIRNLSPGDPWAAMRIGRQRGTTVYIAPRERGIKGRGGQVRRRPNLADLLMGRAMQPALERNRDQVEHRFNQLIGEAAALWSRA